MPNIFHGPGCNCGGCFPAPNGDRRRLCRLEYATFPCGCQYEEEAWIACEVHTIRELMARLPRPVGT